MTALPRPASHARNLARMVDRDTRIGYVDCRRRCASCSYLAITNLTTERADPVAREQAHRMAGAYRGGDCLYVRDWDTFAAWFDGTDVDNRPGCLATPPSAACRNLPISHCPIPAR